MHKTVKAVLPLVFLASVVISSGCTGLNPEALAMAHPMIQDFLEEHPNADIKMTHFSADQAENILEQIRTECDNPYVGPKEYYRINITDPDTDFYAVVWVDWESQQIECAWKLGVEGKETERPKEDAGCEHHIRAVCKDGHIYWFDSCNNREDKRLYCPEGCAEGSDTCLESVGCTAHSDYKCVEGHLYWYDSCGNMEEKKHYCEFGCDDGFCKEPERKTCELAGGYCLYPQPIACTADAKICPDGTAVSRVAPSCEFALCPVTAETEHDVVPDCSKVSDEVCPEACSIGADSDCCEAKEGYEWVEGQGCIAIAAVTGFVISEPVLTETDYAASSTIDGTATDVVAPTVMTNTMVACRPGYKLEDDYFCPENGYCCIPVEEPKCYDTDGGRNLEEAGVVEASDGRTEDHCNSDGTLTEKYCHEGRIAAVNVACPTGTVCREGACVKVAEPVVCEETDAGLDYYNAGVVESGDYRKEDYCVEGAVVEYVCREGVIKVEDYRCPNGCLEGACLEKCAAAGEMTSGPVAPDYYYECCEGLQPLDASTELLGAGMVCYDPEKGPPECLGAGTDDEGWYYPETNELLKQMDCDVAEVVCEETDEGLDYYNAGVVESGDDRKEDYCVEEAVVEYVCHEGVITVEDYACPSGCLEGACIEDTNQTS